MVGVTLTTPPYCLVLNSTLVPRKYHMFVELSTFQQRSPSFCQQVQQQESLPLSHRAHGSMCVPAHLCPQRYHNAGVFPVTLMRYRSCISVHPGSCAWSRSASVPRVKRMLHHPEYSDCSMGWEEECEEKKMGKPWSWRAEREEMEGWDTICAFFHRLFSYLLVKSFQHIWQRLLMSDHPPSPAIHPVPPSSVLTYWGDEWWWQWCICSVFMFAERRMVQSYRDEG